MYEMLKNSKEEQAQYYKEASVRSNNIKDPILMEKDFWVCWTLDRIFKNTEINSMITFKGGTSLSKCYNLISRFSEDCDLTLNKEFLGITESTVEIFQKSRKQRDKALSELSLRAARKVNEYIKPILIADFKANLSNYYDANDWQIRTDPSDEQSLLFDYPSVLLTNTNEYVASAVKLEFGARGDINPSEVKVVSPYVYSLLPDIFDEKPVVMVNSLTPERTFWEKITLLHAEHFRSVTKPQPKRIFRHYYDIVMLDKYGVTKSALKNLELLDAVLLNKKTFFHSSSANYDSAKIGSLKLVPKKEFFENLKLDCKKMADMFFDDPPEFDRILDQIYVIEKMING